MATGEDQNGTAKQMEEFASDQPTADRAGLISSADGATNGHARGDGPRGDGPRSPDKVSASSVESGSEVSPLHMDQESAKAGTWHAEGLRVIIISCVVFSISVTVALIITIYYGPPQVAPHGAVASSSAQCSKVGTDILQDKGSAVDAAIAAVLCEGVVSSHLTGIGGGGFMVYRDHKNKKTFTINFREMAPAAASEDMYDKYPSDKKYGPKSVAVPGLLKGLESAHKLYGKKPWKELVMPAVNLARNGFNVTQYLANAIRDKIVNSDTGAESQGLVEMFHIDGKPPNAGDKLTLPRLANTLEEIATKGAEVFYSGHIAEDIARDMKNSGYITLEDLKAYTITSPEPIESVFQNLTLQTLPPPAGGATVMTILNVMNQYGVSAQNKSDNLTYHRLIEAMKFALAFHDTLGDPDAGNKAAILNITKEMLSNQTAQRIRSRINDMRVFNASYYGNLGTSPESGTSHVSVVGPNEEMVSMTTSLNEFFGSLFVTNNGIILNNQMMDFSVPGGDDGKDPNENNYIAPGKRPLSSISPIIVSSDRHMCAPRYAIGSTNGHEIAAGVAEVLLNLIGFAESMEEAIAAKRLIPDRFTNVVSYEDGLDTSLVNFLGSLGHHMKKMSGAHNMVNAAGKVNETVSAVTDMRTPDGKASVF